MKLGVIKNDKVLKTVLIIVITIALIVFFSILQFNKVYNEIKFIHEESNLEDYHFIEKYGNSLTDENIKSLRNEKIYIQKSNYSEFIEDKYIFHVFEDQNFNINKPKIFQGNMPKDINEIALSSIYMEINNLVLGNFIEIGDKKFEIVASIMMPNYTVPIVNNQVPIIKNDEQAVVAIVHKDAFEEDLVYVAAKADMSITEFKENVMEYTSILEEIEISDVPNEVKTTIKVSDAYNGMFLLTPVNENIRVTFFFDEYNQIYSVLKFLFITMIIVIISILFLFSKYMIEVNSKNIGIFYSLGYSNATVNKLFLSSIGLSFLIGSIIAVVLYLFGVKNLIDSLISQFYFVTIKTNMNLEIAIAIIASFIFVLINAYIVISFINTKSISNIIRQHKTYKNLFRVNFKNPILKLKILEYSNINKYIINVVVSFLVISTTLSILFVNTFSILSKNIGEDILLYNNAVYYENINVDLNDSTKFLTLRTYLEDFNGEYISLYGVDHDNGYVKLRDKDGNDLYENMNDGIIISKLMSKKYGLNIGDSISIFNPVNNNYEYFYISGVNTIPWKNFAYISKEKLNDILGLQQGSYNSIYTLEDESSILNKELNGEVEEIAFIENKESLVNSFEDKVFRYQIIAIGAFIINILILVSILLFIIKINIREKRKSISILASMAYSDKSIYKNLVSTYFIDVLISSVISTFMTYIIYKVNIENMAKTSMVIPPNDFNLIIHLGIISLFLLLYMLISRMFFRSIKNINIAEHLKSDD